MFPTRGTSQVFEKEDDVVTGSSKTDNLFTFGEVALIEFNGSMR